MRFSDELRDRTKQYASAVVRYYTGLPRERREVEVLGHQWLRSGTSVAANAREASRARSDAQFIAKIGILLQEADESALWLELLVESCHFPSEANSALQQETNELIAIFTTIVSKVRQNLQ